MEILKGISFLSLRDLELPEDVIKVSGPGMLTLFGEVKDKENEIVVITYRNREVFTAEVRHMCRKYEDTKFNFVNHVSGFFGTLLLKNPVKEFDGIKYTMACLADKELDIVENSWLF